jgi:hypothetical protein
MKSSRIRRMKEFKPNGQSIFWITGRIDKTRVVLAVLEPGEVQ